MSLRTIIYCLKSDPKTGKTILSYDLNSEEILVSNTLEHVVLRLGGKLLTIPKAIYVNRKIYDTGQTYFYIATKQIRTEYVFNVLLDYAEKKVDTRISFLQTLKEQFRKERKNLIAA